MAAAAAVRGPRACRQADSQVLSQMEVTYFRPSYSDLLAISAYHVPLGLETALSALTAARTIAVLKLLGPSERGSERVGECSKLFPIETNDTEVASFNSRT